MSEIKLKKIEDTINIGGYFMGRVNAAYSVESLYPIDFPDTEKTIAGCYVFFGNDQYESIDVNVSIMNNTLFINGKTTRQIPIDSSIGIVTNTSIILKRK